MSLLNYFWSAAASCQDFGFPLLPKITNYCGINDEVAGKLATIFSLLCVRVQSGVRDYSAGYASLEN